jgi:bifunctional non-homologous end joining protein LigD
VSLAFKQGGSDKVYHAHLQPEGSGWIVTAEYGRRGSAKKVERKTPEPIAYDAAKKAFDKLVKSKLAKGYSLGESGVPFQNTPKEGRTTGLVPQRLNPVDDVEPLMADPAWWAQEKYDGNRVMIQRKGSEVIGSNKLGLTIALPHPVVDQVLAAPGSDFVLDGELVGDTYHAFDVVMDGPYSVRLQRLAALLGREPPTGRTEAQKRALHAEVKARNGEGLVFKRHDAPYTPGKPNSGGPQLKAKFTETASCIVLGRNGAKRSIQIGLLHDGQLIGVGNVTVPPNQDIPEQDAIVEVGYLYAYPPPGGSLYQPTYKGVREDVPREECATAQLKLKPEAVAAV